MYRNTPKNPILFSPPRPTLGTLSSNHWMTEFLNARKTSFSQVDPWNLQGELLEFFYLHSVSVCRCPSSQWNLAITWPSEASLPYLPPWTWRKCLVLKLKIQGKLWLCPGKFKSFYDTVVWLTGATLDLYYLPSYQCSKNHILTS